jgi:hypothetical protein
MAGKHMTCFSLATLLMKDGLCYLNLKAARLHWSQIISLSHVLMEGTLVALLPIASTP